MAGCLESQFQNHIPARGRKHRTLAPLFFIPPAVISKPHPRKGTECANPSLPCRSGGGGPCEAWWKGRLERSAYLHREKGTSAVSAPTGSHRSPPPPFRRGRRIEHIPARGRKHGNAAYVVYVGIVNFKTTSPQGDGMCEPQPPLPQRGRGTMRSMVEGAPRTIHASPS